MADPGRVNPSATIDHGRGTADMTKLYSTAAVSRNGRVEVDGAEPTALTVIQPVELGGSGSQEPGVV